MAERASFDTFEMELYLASAREARNHFASVPEEFAANKKFVEEWIKRRHALKLPSSNNDLVLYHASPTLCADRDLVLKAVALNGASIEFAHSDLRRDRDVILAAVGTRERGYARAFEFAPADLFSDAELVQEVQKFAGSAAESARASAQHEEDEGGVFYILRVALLSGKSCTVIAEPCEAGRDIRDRACELLELDGNQKMQLLLQDEVVHEGGAKGSVVAAWPGVSLERVNHLLLLVCEGREVWDCAVRVT